MRNGNVNRSHCKDCCIMRYSDSIEFTCVVCMQIRYVVLIWIPTENHQCFTSLVTFDFTFFVLIREKVSNNKLSLTCKSNMKRLVHQQKWLWKKISAVWLFTCNDLLRNVDERELAQFHKTLLHYWEFTTCLKEQNTVIMFIHNNALHVSGRIHVWLLFCNDRWRKRLIKRTLQLITFLYRSRTLCHLFTSVSHFHLSI